MHCPGKKLNFWLWGPDHLDKDLILDVQIIWTKSAFGRNLHLGKVAYGRLDHMGRDSALEIIRVLQFFVIWENVHLDSVQIILHFVIWKFSRL